MGVCKAPSTAYFLVKAKLWQKFENNVVVISANSF